MRILFCCPGVPAEPWLKGLRAALPHAEVEAWQAGAPPADHAVVWAPPQAMLDEQPGLRALFNMGAGVDALMGLRLPPHALVVRLDDAGMSVQMAEFVCHAVIRQFRSLAAYDADQAEARWAFRKPLVRSRFTVGILGLGVLGERVAKALQSFEFPVQGWSRRAKSWPGMLCHTGAEGLQSLLASSRVLVNVLPLTDDTRNLLNHARLSQLPRGAHLINVARGEHVVDDDLLALLDMGHLGGATLDVFREEPLPASHRFWRHPLVTVSPHTAARTDRDASIAQIAHKIEALARGEAVAGVVDRVRGY